MSRKGQIAQQSTVQPIQPRGIEKDRGNVGDVKEEYARIMDKLQNKVKKPLKNLRAMIESEIDRLKNK